MQDDYLVHYGVLGMKWGVRNAETKAKYASAKKAGKRQAKKEAKAARKAEDKQIKNIARERRAANRRRSLLSDEELDTRIRRLQKEKQLRELTSSEVNAGRNQVSSWLKKNGQTTATSLLETGLRSKGIRPNKKN